MGLGQEGIREGDLQCAPCDPSPITRRLPPRAGPAGWLEAGRKLKGKERASAGEAGMGAHTGPRVTGGRGLGRGMEGGRQQLAREEGSLSQHNTQLLLQGLLGFPGMQPGPGPPGHSPAGAGRRAAGRAGEAWGGWCRVLAGGQGWRDKVQTPDRALGPHRLPSMTMTSAPTLSNVAALARPACSPQLNPGLHNCPTILHPPYPDLGLSSKN